MLTLPSPGHQMPPEQLQHVHSPWRSICSTAVNRALFFCTTLLKLQYSHSPVCSTTKDTPKHPENPTTGLVCLRVWVCADKSVPSLSRVPEPQPAILHTHALTWETSSLLSRDPSHSFPQANKTFPEEIPEHVNWKISQIPLMHYQCLPTVTDWENTVFLCESFPSTSWGLINAAGIMASLIHCQNCAWGHWSWLPKGALSCCKIQFDSIAWGLTSLWIALTLRSSQRWSSCLQTCCSLHFTF